MDHGGMFKNWISINGRVSIPCYWSTDTFNFLLTECLSHFLDKSLDNKQKSCWSYSGEQWMRRGLFRKSGLSCHSVTWHTRGGQAQEPKGGLYWSRPKCISAALWFELNWCAQGWLRLRPGLQAIMNRIDAGCQTTDHLSAPQSKTKRMKPCIYFCWIPLCNGNVHFNTHI